MDSVDKIPVSAQVSPANPDVCAFTVGKSLFPGDSYNCASPDAPGGDDWGLVMAKGSPLLEALFRIEGVTQVWVSDDRMTVQKTGEEPWPVLGKRIAKVVRDLLREGRGPLVVPAPSRGPAWRSSSGGA